MKMAMDDRVMKQVWCSGNILDLYFGSTLFESWLVIGLSRQIKQDNTMK
jgi:hypothetical protein